MGRHSRPRFFECGVERLTQFQESLVFLTARLHRFELFANACQVFARVPQHRGPRLVLGVQLVENLLLAQLVHRMSASKKKLGVGGCGRQRGTCTFPPAGFTTALHLRHHCGGSVSGSPARCAAIAASGDSGPGVELSGSPSASKGVLSNDSSMCVTRGGGLRNFCLRYKCFICNYLWTRKA